MPLGYISKNAVDTAIISVSSKGMWGGNVAAILGFLSSNSFAVFVGVAVTILGAVSSEIFRRRKDAREEKQLAADERRKEEIHALKLLHLQRQNYEDR